RLHCSQRREPQTTFPESRQRRRMVRHTRVHPSAAGSAALGAGDGLLLEDVLDFLAGLLGLALALVGGTLGLQPIVPGGLTDLLLCLAVHLLGLVLGLVVDSHYAPSSVSPIFQHLSVHEGSARSARSINGLVGSCLMSDSAGCGRLKPRRMGTIRSRRRGGSTYEIAAQQSEATGYPRRGVGTEGESRRPKICALLLDAMTSTGLASQR